LRDLDTYKSASEVDALSAFGSQDARPLWAAAHAGAVAALEAIRGERKPLVEEAAAEFLRDIAPEIGFLQWRMQKISDEEAHEIEKEIALRQRLATAICNESIALDAIALVQGTSESEIWRQGVIARTERALGAAIAPGDRMALIRELVRLHDGYLSLDVRASGYDFRKAQDVKVTGTLILPS